MFVTHNQIERFIFSEIIKRLPIKLRIFSHSVMVEDKNIVDKRCVKKQVTKKSKKINSSGFISNCDNVHKIQQLIVAGNSTEHRPFQFGLRDGEKKTQEITVIGADQTNNHNCLSVNSTAIDSRGCFKPEKKVIKSCNKTEETYK